MYERLKRSLENERGLEDDTQIRVLTGEKMGEKVTLRPFVTRLVCLSAALEIESSRLVSSCRVQPTSRSEGLERIRNAKGSLEKLTMVSGFAREVICSVVNCCLWV